MSGRPLPRYGFFTLSSRREGLTNGNFALLEHDFLQNDAVLSPDGRSTTFRHLETGEKFMQVPNGVVEAIGHTPLIKLKRASAATGCTILGKAEFMNPGGSVKDRPGRQMILEAEKRGELKPGGLVVEGTAGNTGIGLAIVAAARGYRTLIVIPNTQSQEKKDMLRLCGAELIEVPALPYNNPDNYQHVARRLADKLRKTEKNGVLFADQWNNRDNRLAHYLSTGPEIWEQTQGNVDGFICSVGTGGTLAGTSTSSAPQSRSMSFFSWHWVLGMTISVR